MARALSSPPVDADQTRARTATSERGPMALLGAIACAGAVWLLGGCATESNGPDFLPVASSQYERVFDAACEVARGEGLIPEITDRRAGSIETQPRIAGSALEPWAWQDLTASEVVEGTFGFERRRARFEFVPAGFRPVPPEGTSPLAGPVLPGSSRGSGADVMQPQGDRRQGDQKQGDQKQGDQKQGELELRVSVSVERQFRPGYQGPAYTRALGSFATDVTVKDDPRALRDRSLWTPVARDERLERLLLERIAARVAVPAES
ncbi:MAG: hypothetical protein ACKO3W_14880 [bacterium]